MIRKKLFITAAAFAAIVGCNKTEILQPEDYKYTLEPNEIAFRASSVGTKTFTETTAETLKAGWKCLALIDGTDVLFNTGLSYDNGLYRENGKTWYYPQGKTLDFYGCYPVSMSIDAATKTINYTQNSDTDLVVATKSGMSAQSDAVAMDFSHILSQIDIKVKGSDTNVDYYLKGLYVSAPNGGTYSFATDSWSSLGTVTEYTYLSTTGTTVSTSTLEGLGSPMSFIPGPVKLRAVWDCTIQGEETLVASYDVTVNVTLQKGMHSTLSLTLPNEESKPIPFEITVSTWKTENNDIEMGPTNLAMLDYAGNKLNSANTANCYIIRRKDSYKIPLVYGNAIKNGQTNVESFYTEGIATDFEDSYGIPFTASSSPYIKNHAFAQGKSIASAEVLWNDGTSTITNLSVDNDFLTFDVESFSPSNALIAVKDNDGTILWSWHLWLTNEVLTPKVITNADGVDFKIMPCNLGWNGWTADGNPTSPYYQWGRKDPFIANGTVTYESISNTQEQYISHQNPINFYNCSGSWTTDKYKYFWDSKMNGYSVDQKVTKTIYDPCPIGWSIPQYDTFTGLSKDNTEFADNGRYCTTKDGSKDLFIPLSGSRNCSSGSVSSVGDDGYCWLSAPYSENDGRQLYLDMFGLYPQSYNYRCFGYSVRPLLTE